MKQNSVTQKQSITLRVVLGLALGLTFVGQAYAADTAMPNAQRGEELFTKGDASRGILACIACHGPGGNSTSDMYPNLAQQPAQYIVNQLKNFQVKKGAKGPDRLDYQGKPTAMAPIVLNLTEQDMQDLAAYISAQKLTAPANSKFSTDIAMIEAGRDIYRGGIASRNVPACASCHGATGMGIPVEFPRLQGQHPGYLYNQLIAFADGHRKNGGHENMMGTIANRMSREEIKAVADYAAGLR